MAGLFDAFGDGWEDPKSQAIMALSAGLMQGTPQGLSQGLLAASQAPLQAKERDLKARYVQSQIAENEAQSQSRTQQAALQQQQVMGAQQKQQALQSVLKTYNGQVDKIPVQTLFEIGLNTDEIKKLGEITGFGKAEVARTMDGIGPDGNPVSTQYDKYGNPVGAAIPKFQEPKVIDDGQTKFIWDPNNSKTTPLAKNQLTPGQMADNERKDAELAAKGPAKGSPEAQAKSSGAVLDLIGEINKHLDNATGSYLGAGVDQAAAIFGQSTQGAQEAAKVKALAGALVMQLPRPEGPQSDRDMAFIQEQAGRAGDSTLPIATRKAALQAIAEYHQSNLAKQRLTTGQDSATGQQGMGAAAGNSSKMLSRAEYDSLPSGSVYTAPDGKQRIKK